MPSSVWSSHEFGTHYILCQCAFINETVPKDWLYFIERMQTIGVWRTGPPILDSASPQDASYYYIFEEGCYKDQLADARLFERLVKEWYRGLQVRVTSTPVDLRKTYVDDFTITSGVEDDWFNQSLTEFSA